MTRLCRQCNVNKPLSEFTQITRTARSGDLKQYHLNKCKSCYYPKRLNKYQRLTPDQLVILQDSSMSKTYRAQQLNISFPTLQLYIARAAQAAASE